jgi:hypothetical protein
LGSDINHDITGGAWTKLEQGQEYIQNVDFKIGRGKNIFLKRKFVWEDCKVLNDSLSHAAMMSNYLVTQAINYTIHRMRHVG